MLKTTYYLDVHFSVWLLVMFAAHGVKQETLCFGFISYWIDHSML